MYPVAVVINISLPALLIIFCSIFIQVGKIVARNSAPIMALQGKNVIEIDHTIRLRERADHYNFFDTANEIERMVKQQEETLLKMASKQIRDTGRLYHVKESNQVEFDLDETDVWRVNERKKL